jgi:sec-independent protein translocase protein TatC
MADELNLDEDPVGMNLGDHVEALRARLISGLSGLAVAGLVSLAAGKWFLALILLPYRIATHDLGMDVKLQTIEVAEPFMVYLKAVLVLAVLLSSPWLFYQGWAFASAGLYRRERRMVYMAAPASAVLFVAGVLFFLLTIAPMMLKYFAGFNPGVEQVYQPQMTQVVDFILMTALVFGLAFQTPIAIVFAERMGLVSVATLRRARKHVLLGSFVISAVATPPDALSQVALAIPLYILYEASIVTCRCISRR